MKRIAFDRAIEVDRAKNIVATFSAGGTASGVAFASPLENGDTLITDENNNRAVEVDSKDRLRSPFGRGSD